MEFSRSITSRSDEQSLESHLNALFQGLDMIAEGHTTPFEFHEKTGVLTALMLGITSLLILFFCVKTDLAFGAKTVTIALSALFAIAALKFYKRGRTQPALTLTDTGFTTPGLPHEIPWTDIQSYEVVGSGSGRDLSFHFYLHDAVSPPQIQKSALKCGYNSKKHRIQILVMMVKKFMGVHIDAETACREIESRLDAAYARRA